jgi:4'-phosphopantetheinyl transferase
MISDSTQARASESFAKPEQVLSLRDSTDVLESEVHLWPFELRVDDITLRACERVLSVAERARAERFVFDKDKRQFVVAHAVLRHLLSLYSGVAPQEIGFECSANGKPRLCPTNADHSRGNIATRNVSFNLSHSQHRAVVGISRSSEIGVDLEMLRRDIDVLSLAESCFFGAEIAAIRGAPLGQRPEAFFRYWVAKEAVLKGEGIGLGYPLDRFEVRFTTPDSVVGYITSSDTAQLSGDWTVRVVRLAEGWPAAVACRGTGWNVRVRSAH